MVRTIKNIESSNIAKVSHDDKKELLTITFKGNGATYEYNPVTLEGFRMFRRAESKGKFFAANIKNNKDIKCTRVFP